VSTTPPARVFAHRRRVAYHECDGQLVVFNGHYLTWFDDALTELMREAFGSYHRFISHGADLMVVEANLRYLASAAFDDLVDVRFAPVRLGTTSAVSEIDVVRVESGEHDGPPRRAGELLVEGRMVHVFVGPGTGEKREIPAAVREGLMPYLREPR
jgi:acyl-CoA thioester hydrolase